MCYNCANGLNWGTTVLWAIQRHYCVSNSEVLLCYGLQGYYCAVGYIKVLLLYGLPALLSYWLHWGTIVLWVKGVLLWYGLCEVLLCCRLLALLNYGLHRGTIMLVTQRNCCAESQKKALLCYELSALLCYELLKILCFGTISPDVIICGWLSSKHRLTNFGTTVVGEVQTVLRVTQRCGLQWGALGYRYYYKSFYSLGKRPPEPPLPSRPAGTPRVSCDDYDNGSCRWYDEWNNDHLLDYEYKKYTLIWPHSVPTRPLHTPPALLFVPYPVPPIFVPYPVPETSIVLPSPRDFDRPSQSPKLRSSFPVPETSIVLLSPRDFDRPTQSPRLRSSYPVPETSTVLPRPRDFDHPTQCPRLRSSYPVPETSIVLPSPRDFDRPTQSPRLRSSYPVPETSIVLPSPRDFDRPTQSPRLRSSYPVLGFSMAVN